MKPFEIYISYVSWGSGGKHRPVLVFSLKDATAFIYPIKSRYENKSEAIKTNYFEITNWQYAGLDRLSYIDTGSYFTLPVSALNNKIPIGELSLEDRQRLLAFLVSKNSNKQNR